MLAENKTQAKRKPLNQGRGMLTLSSYIDLQGGYAYYMLWLLLSFPIV